MSKVNTDPLEPGRVDGRLAILVVDDDPGITHIIGQALEGQGHRVTSASDGRAAERATKATSFDVVITDILMPGKDGYELISALRKQDSNTRIIAMSGGGRAWGDHYLKLARGLGAHAVLAKPFTQSELTATLDAVFASPKS